MKALVCEKFGPPGDLQLKEVADPVPRDKEVLIRVHAAGINFPDLLMIQGQYQDKREPPFIPGAEVSGVVESVGEKVRRVKPGDRVIATPLGGAFAEKCTVREPHCMPLPDQLDFEQGAGFTITYATTWHAFRQRGRLHAGETVLVLGAAGGVGSAAVEIAHAMGARVIAAASSQEKLDFARAAGADECINYREDSLRERLKELTGGKGVDVVYDPVGGDAAQAAYRALAWHGRYLVIGFASGDIPAFPANIALLKEASVMGVWWGTWAARHPDESLQNMVKLAAKVAAGELRPVVSERYPLADFANAFAALQERRALGKVVLTLQ